MLLLERYIKLIGNRFLLGIVLVTIGFTINGLSLVLFHYDISTGNQVQVTQVQQR